MSFLQTFLLEPMSHAFMVRALIVALMVGVVCAVLSCYLILKGWALMGDAISHAVFPGIVISYVWKIPVSIGAFVAGISCAVMTGLIKENSRLKEDTVMGVVFSGLFAFGLVLFTKIETDQHLLHILFGNLLGVSWQDIRETALVAGFVIFIVLIKWRDLLLYCFDPVQARMAGLSVRLLQLGFLTMLSLTIVASLKAVGVILVIAMLIAPGATAFLLTKSFSKMLYLSVAVAVSSCVMGTLASFHFDVATGPCIVVFQALIFIIALTLSLRAPQLAGNSSS